VVRNCFEHLGQKAPHAIGGGAIAGTQSCAEQQALLVHECQQGMETTIARVAVARSLLEVAIDLEDRAVEIDGHRSRAADALEHCPRRTAVDALHLTQVSEREGAQSLARGGRGRDLHAKAQLARHRFLTQDLEIGETVTTHQKVGCQPHHEILDRDAAPALLDRQGLEVADHAELGGQLEYESQAGERGGVMSSGFELDAAEAAWNLHLTSAPSLERET
jgi:hypothetical protein